MSKVEDDLEAELAELAGVVEAIDEEEDKDEALEPATPSTVRLSAADWEKLVAEYESSLTVSVIDLAVKWGVSRTAIQMHFKRLKDKGYSVARGSKAVGASKPTAGPAAEPTWEDKRRARIEIVREDSYKTTRALRQLNIGLVVEAKRAGASFATIKEQLRALRIAMATEIEGSNHDLMNLEAAKNSDPNELPEIRIINLTDEDIKELRAGDEDDSPEMPALELEEEVVVIE